MGTSTKSKYDWGRIDPLLVDVYTTSKGTISQISRRTGIPPSTLTNRALQVLKLKPRKTLEPYLRYRPEEDAILIANPRQHIPVIVKKLKKAGFNRDEQSILSRLSLLREKGIIPKIDEELEELGIYTTMSLAEEMGITKSRVLWWIGQGKLTAKEQPMWKGESRTRRYLIHRKDVREFLVKHELLYDHTLCRHGFLLDVLANDVKPMIQHRCGRSSEVAHGFEVFASQ